MNAHAPGEHAKIEFALPPPLIDPPDTFVRHALIIVAVPDDVVTEPSASAPVKHAITAFAVTPSADTLFVVPLPECRTAMSADELPPAVIVPVDAIVHAARRPEVAVIRANPADAVPETAIAAVAVPVVVTAELPALVAATMLATPSTVTAAPSARDAITVDAAADVVIDPPCPVDSEDAMRPAMAPFKIAMRAPRVFDPERHARIAEPLAPVIDMSLVVPVPMCSHATIPQPALPLPAVMLGKGVALPEFDVAMIPVAEAEVGAGQSKVPSAKQPKDGVLRERPPARPTPMFVPSK